jgi:hypothetical protein
MRSSRLPVKYTAESMGSEPDPSRCPLCGGPNGCAVEAGGEAAACWCMQVEMGDEVLERVPEPARNRACVCAACARGDAESAPARRPLRTFAR